MNSNLPEKTIYSDEFTENVKPRKIRRSLEEYWRSVADTDNKDFFSLGYQWNDKPYRHVFDLIAHGLFQEQRIRELEQILKQQNPVA